MIERFETTDSFDNCGNEKRFVNIDTTTGLKNFYYYLCCQLKGGGMEIIMNNDVKKIIFCMMEEEFDEIMNTYGFRRRKNSYTYLREVDTTKQKIEILFFLHPSYQVGALAHIYPWLSVYYPKVNKIAREMISEDSMIACLKDKTIRQPIQIYSNAERWMLKNDKDSNYLSKNIAMFLEKYTIPLLNDLKNVEGFIRMYEQKDKRIIMDDAKYIFVASSYVLQRDYQKGLMVLEKRFGRPGLRERYSLAFEYIESRL